MFFSNLERITGGKVLRLSQDQPITDLITDSRKAVVSRGGLFLAIRGIHHDGHQFIPELYEKGIRQFMVEQPPANVPGGANVILVESSIKALQEMAAWHRAQLTIPIVGITGSNGKTIIKEWLYQLLSSEFNIAKNPASYNSQLGVPLSVWQIEKHHTLGIFEAGISTIHEMENLGKVLRPDIGILTNIGPAHDEGFENTEEKIREKLKLFKDSSIVIYCKDQPLVDGMFERGGFPSLSWGESEKADITVARQPPGYQLTFGGKQFTLRLPFSDHASTENCFHCVALMLHLGIDPEKIQQRILSLRAVPMRLELKEGINRCQIIDDTYNNDLAGLQVSLDFLTQQHQKEKKRVILSDIHQSGLSDPTLVKKISSLISAAGVDRFTGIGPVLSSFHDDFPAGSKFYRSTEDFLTHFNFNELEDEVILIKGARVFAFEKIVRHVQRKVHGTVMEIDLGALVHNLNYFKSRLKSSTRIMAMVKAFGYGSGSNEVANLLQYHRVDYLGVAYTDEGVDLRKNNIALPIMVMNPAEQSFETLLKYKLEPEVYNFNMLHRLSAFLGEQPCRIHIKVDTGMHRLGFNMDEIEGLIVMLLDHPNLTVVSVFSHLAAADEEVHDSFSREQAGRFLQMAEKISTSLKYRPLYHLLNSAGILRLPDLQFDMVRLGIGLYGVDPTGGEDHLKPATTLKTVISQIRSVPAGESIGYGRHGRAKQALRVATIAIGYADGFSRAFSGGVGTVLVNERPAKVIGNVCMDMTMIDVTGIPAHEGDEVIVFGKGNPIQQLAESIRTIPYEILTHTSERVKRVFIAESI